jgi:hypothetical protein
VTDVAPPRPTATWREVGALILLPFGGLLVPVVGWFAGVVLLWVSDAWTTRDKVIGTLLPPGGVSSAVLLLLAAQAVIVPDGGPGWSRLALFWLILATLVVLPLAVDAYLLWRLRAGPR